jgi:hypothetical protein
MPLQSEAVTILEREEETELARRLMGGDAGALDRFVEYFRAKIF